MELKEIRTILQEERIIQKVKPIRQLVRITPQSDLIIKQPEIQIVLKDPKIHQSARKIQHLVAKTTCSETKIWQLKETLTSQMELKIRLFKEMITLFQEKAISLTKPLRIMLKVHRTKYLKIKTKSWVMATKLMGKLTHYREAQ